MPIAAGAVKIPEPIIAFIPVIVAVDTPILDTFFCAMIFLWLWGYTYMNIRYTIIFMVI